MRPIGYSTGALALSDVRGALAMLRGSRASAIELSALRMAELGPLLEMVSSLDLSAFSHISVHAPSRFTAAEEPGVVNALATILPLGWPIVLHPDAIHDFGAWRQFGGALAIENMDKRKPIGRTVQELERVFARLPDASFCFDLGHARQIDRTMNEAYFLVKELGPRLRQLHVSEVNTQSRHDPISRAAVCAFQKVARWVPESVPLILESPATVGEIDAQMSMAREALSALPGDAAMANA